MADSAPPIEIVRKFMQTRALFDFDFFIELFYYNTGKNKQISRGKFVVNQRVVLFTVKLTDYRAASGYCQDSTNGD